MTTQTQRLTVPTSCFAGVDNLASPPVLVKTLAGLIEKASFEMVDNCGHLPSIEQPAAMARAICKIHEILN